MSSDTLKVALVASTYTPNINTHVFFSDVTNEVTGTGYTAGGATLASLITAVDNTNNRASWSAGNATWSTSTITARGAVVYKSTGVSTTSPLLCYFDFTTDQVSSAGTFSIVWNANGLLLLS